VQQIAARAFFARGDTWRPMLLGTGLALLAIPLYLKLGARAGAAGLASAGALAMSANALATLLLARRLHGAPSLGALAGTGLRALAVAVPAALAAHLTQLGAGGTWGDLADLALAGIAFGLVALVGIRLLGDAAMREALRRVIRSRA
jgi:putative peptidoglycan lipid II flippase